MTTDKRNISIDEDTRMESHNSLQAKAKCHFLSKEWKKARLLYLQLLDDEPDNVRYNAAVGEACACLGQYPSAIRYFEKAISVLESLQLNDIKEIEFYGTVYFLLGQCRQLTGDDEISLKNLEKSAQIRPDWPDPQIELGKRYFDRGEHEKSLTAFRKVVQISPNDGSAWLTIAHIEQILKNDIAAAEAARQVLALDPNSEQAQLMLAESLRKTGYCRESVEFYESVIRSNPNHVQALYGYGQSLLATGDLERGWMGFEGRRFCEAGTWGNHFLPEWNGETGKLCSVLAYGEGGIASEIQFASCLSDLGTRVGHCFVECNKVLRTLFERSFPEMTIISQSADAMTPDEYPGMYFDAQVAFGTLPRFFRSDFSLFPQTRKSYLIADPQKTAHWKKLFADLPGERKIGILHEGSWSTEPKEQCRLPLEGVEKLFESASSDEVGWVSLQHGSRRKEWLKFCEDKQTEVRHFPEAFATDLDELAAMISALDLVIAPSGFQAHLAAALGVPCWVVLPRECDWRWHLSRNDSPWYPNARLFRRKHGETWSGLSQRLLVAFHSYLSYDEPMPIIPFVRPENFTGNFYSAAGCHPVGKKAKSA